MNTLHRYAVNVMYWLRLALSFVDGSRARRGRQWDALRAEAIRRNRSEGAKRGWETRRENLNRWTEYFDDDSDAVDVG